jgi:hypothetical protein
MIPIDRRQFVRNLATALAAASAGATLESCAAVQAGYRRSPRQANMKAVLARLDEISDTIGRDEGLRFVEDFYRERGVSPDLLKDSLISLLTIGVFGDLCESDRNHPDMQQRLRLAGPAMDRAVFGTATLLEGLTCEERLTVQRVLKKHPEILGTFQVEFDSAAQANSVPSIRLRHFNALFNKCAWRVEKQGLAVVTDDVIAAVDKVATKEGVSPDDRRRLARQWGYTDAYTGTNPLRGAASRQLSGDSPPEITGQALQSDQYLEKGRRRVRTGLTLMGIGLVDFGIGTAFVLYDGNTWPVSATLGMTGGGILFVTGIIVALVGAANLRKAKELQASSEKSPEKPTGRDAPLVEPSLP